jgi:GAF domain-containing protein
MTSLLGVPVSIHERIVGDLYLTDKIGADEFSDEDEWWISLFAQQAAVAIENANLYRQVQLAQQQTQALADLTDALSGSNDLATLYQQIADSSCQLLDIAGAAIYLFDKHYEKFTAKASAGLIFPFNSHEPQPIQIHAIVRQVVLKNKAVVIPDMSSMNLLHTFHLQNGDTPKSVLMVPIRVSGRVSGMVAVYSGRFQHFNQQEVTLLETFAIKAGLMLEKTLLYQHKEEFLSMTAHDLRAPLTAIKMSAELLEVSLPLDLPSPLHRLVSNIHRNSERLNNMLDDLLDLTRL